MKAAGKLGVHKGRLKELFFHSGHYRPDKKDMRTMLKFLEAHGVDLYKVKVDVQTITYVSREPPDRRTDPHKHGAVKSKVKLDKSQTVHFESGGWAIGYMDTFRLRQRLRFYQEVKDKGEIMHGIQKRKYQEKDTGHVERVLPLPPLFAFGVKHTTPPSSGDETADPLGSPCPGYSSILSACDNTSQKMTLESYVDFQCDLAPGGSPISISSTSSVYGREDVLLPSQEGDEAEESPGQ